MTINRDLNLAKSLELRDQFSLEQQIYHNLSWCCLVILCKYLSSLHHSFAPTVKIILLFLLFNITIFFESKIVLIVLQTCPSI